MQKSIELEIGGNLLKIETHRWAKQSNGSAVITYADNMLLVTANMRDEAKVDQDFFPLMVDFRENNYSAGKIPGGFFKREGKPSEREVLLSRLIDRPIRPLFPEDFYNDTQVIAMLLSADFSIDYDSCGIIGASAALLSSTIPFSTPVAAVKVGWKDEEFFINPGYHDSKDMEMVIQVAGTENDVVMLEAGGKEFSEDIFKQGLIIAKEHISKICELQKELINPDKLVVEKDQEKAEIFQNLKKKYEKKLKDAIFSIDRADRKEKLKVITDEMMEGLEEDEIIMKTKVAFHDLESEVFRTNLIKGGKRTDGRNYDEIRDIGVELGILPRTHGSAVFTRGETQSLSTVTLGAEDDAQRLDNLAHEGDLKRFMLHYNFPPFSVGEVSFLRGAGRREIGHGNLAEKSLSQVIPDDEDFPYTIRVVSDILESNGSSSMATVCGGSLSLMDAGVPIKAPVAGIAMGLVKEGDKFAVLTDIAGYEDHFGDMDFKVSGTENGICAIQLDIKMGGLSDEIIDKTLEDARAARLYILGKMNEAIAEPSATLSQYAPVITSITINTEKIKDLIGPGGKTIKGLVAKYGVKINTEDDGTVTVAAPNQDVGDEVIAEIEQLTASVEIGKIYNGKITRIEEYGIFVDVLNGATGLVHISEISHQKVRNIKDMNYSIGQMIDCKVVDVDRDNRIKCSIKAMDPSTPYTKKSYDKKPYDKKPHDKKNYDKKPYDKKKSYNR